VLTVLISLADIQSKPQAMMSHWIMMSNHYTGFSTGTWNWNMGVESLFHAHLDSVIATSVELIKYAHDFW